MKIAISTLIVRPERSGSNEPYLVNLIDALAQIDDQNEYLLFVTQQNRRTFERVFSAQFLPVTMPDWAYTRPGRIFLDQFIVPIIAQAKGVDVLHFPGTVGSIVPLPGIKMVVTVHYDIDSAHAPSISWSKRLYFNSLFRLSNRNASLLIVPSQSFGQSLAERWHLPSKKVRVVYHGLNVCLVNQLTPFRTIQDRYGLRPGYLLSVTNSLPHKNLSGLLEAFAILRRQITDNPQLVLVGDIAKAVLYAKKQAIISKNIDLPVDDIISTGFLPHSEVYALYAHAFVMINPSFTESASMTVLEAIANGCPVVASNIPVHHEILGEAGLFVDPSSAKKIASACFQLFGDSSLRQVMISRGLTKAREYSWKKTALDTLSVYQAVNGLTGEGER